MESYYADGLVKALEERNKIEKQRLEFEKEVFEFNKQSEASAIKINTDMNSIMASLLDKFDCINRSIETLSRNDAYLKQEIDKLKVVKTEASKKVSCVHEWEATSGGGNGIRGWTDYTCKYCGETIREYD